MSVFLERGKEKYLSRLRAKPRGWSKYLKSIYICLSESISLRDFWNSVSINIVSLYFFFSFFESIRNSTVSMAENLMFKFKYVKVFLRYEFCIKKKCWISSLHLYRIIHEFMINVARIISEFSLYKIREYIFETSSIINC